MSLHSEGTFSSRVQSFNLGAPVPLGQEARNPRAPVPANRSLIEALNQEISSMNANDIRKLRILKAALLVVTVIGFAIFFIFPVCTLFGISLWIPLVVSLGSAVFLSLTGKKLREQCALIENRYKSIQIYRQHLLSLHPDVGLSALSKYKVVSVNQEKDKTQMDGGRALNSSLDFADSIHSRYEVEALVGLDPLDKIAWKKRIIEVSKVKQALLQGTTSKKSLSDISADALQEGGLDLAALSTPNFLEVADSLRRLCGFGRQIGVSAQEALDRYNRRYLSGKHVALWDGELSVATSLYVKRGKETLDRAIIMYENLSSLINNVHLAEFVRTLEIWISHVQQLADQKGSSSYTEQEISQLEDQLAQLCLYDGCPSGVSKELRSIFVNFKHSAASSSQDYVNRLHALCSRVKAPLQSPYKGDLVNAAEKELMAYLLSLGDLDTLTQQVRLSIELGKLVRSDLEKSLFRHPAQIEQKLRANIESLLILLKQDEWGAVSSRSVEETLSDKAALIGELQQFNLKLNEWSKKYQTLKDKKLAPLLLKETREEYGRLRKSTEEVVALRKDYVDFTKHVSSEKNDHSLEGKLKRCEEWICGALSPRSITEQAPTEADILQWGDEYQKLALELQSLTKELQTIAGFVNREGLSGRGILKQVFLHKKSTLLARSEEKKRLLVAACQKLRHKEAATYDIPKVLEEGVTALETVLVGMHGIDQAIQEGSVEDLKHYATLIEVLQQIDAEKLSCLQQFLAEKADSTLKMMDVNEARKNIKELMEPLITAQNNQKNFLTSRRLDFERLVSDLKHQLFRTKLSKVAVMGCFSVVFTVLGILMISSQLAWLPFLCCALAVVFQLLPYGFTYLINMEERKLLEVNIAQSLIPSGNLPRPDFANESLLRQQYLSNVLNLEGGELHFASSLSKELHDPTVSSRAEDFRKVIAGLKKDAKRLDHKFAKRTSNRGAMSQTQSQRPYRASKEQKLFAAQLSEYLDQCSTTSAFVETRQDELLSALLFAQTEMARYSKEKNHLASLEQALREAKVGIISVQKEFLGCQEVAKLLQQTARSSGTHDKTTKNRAEALIKQAVYMNRLAQGDDRTKAEKELVELLWKAVEEGNFDAIRSHLEVGSCLGASELLSRSRQKSPNKQNVEQLVAATEQELVSNGKRELAPFIRFACDVGGSGRHAARNALQSLTKLLGKINNSGFEDVHPEDCRAASFALANYLKVQDSFRPEAICLDLSNGREYKAISSLSEELLAIKREISDTFGFDYREACIYILKLMDQQAAQWSGCYESDCSKLFHHVIKERVLPENELNQIKQYLEKVPAPLLQHLAKEYSVRAALARQNLQKFQVLEDRCEVVRAVVESKKAIFEDKAGAYQTEMDLLKARLKECKTQMVILNDTKAVLQEAQRSGTMSLINSQVRRSLANRRSIHEV